MSTPSTRTRWCAHFIRAAGKSVFGGGYLLSDAKAAELKAAELKAAEDVTVWQLSDRERHIIDDLGQ